LAGIELGRAGTDDFLRGCWGTSGVTISPPDCLLENGFLGRDSG